MAFYIFIVGWFFTRAGDPAVFLIFAVVTSPLLWAAFYLQGRRIKDFHEKELNSLSFLSHLVALACSVGLFWLVWKMRTGTRFGPMQLFGNLRIGWNMRIAFELLAVEILMAASAATIWAGSRVNGVKPGSPDFRTARLFFAGTREAYRFPIYLYLISFSWALGLGVVFKLYGKDYEMETLVVVLSRAIIPVMALLVIAILRIRIKTTPLISKVIVLGIWLYVIGTIGYLIETNLKTGVATAFIGSQLAAAAVFFAVRSVTVSAGSKAAAVEPAAQDEPSVQEEAKQDG
jgi:hypothetical protein